jgi:hypothetical protein
VTAALLYLTRRSSEGLDGVAHLFQQLLQLGAQLLEGVDGALPLGHHLYSAPNVDGAYRLHSLLPSTSLSLIVPSAALPA